MTKVTDMTVRIVTSQSSLLEKKGITLVRFVIQIRGARGGMRETMQT